MQDRPDEIPGGDGLTIAEVAADQSGQHAEKSWLPRLFEVAGVAPDADLETIQTKMDALANRVAPLTRRWWKWILLLQGAAVLVPLAWLIYNRFLIPAEWVAVSTFLTVVVFVSINWWLRWRGMQKTWARARLVAEVARALLCTKSCPRSPAARILEIVPSLSPLRKLSSRESRSSPLEEWRPLYLQNRIHDQAQYFETKQKEAEEERKRLARWATLMLDIALAFAFAGAVIGLAPKWRNWMGLLHGIHIEIVLGFAGALAPLVLLLVQLLRDVRELNRRTARYAQQQQMLQHAATRLRNATTAEQAMEAVDDTERQLLAEVFEWYFHAETAEHFFLARKPAAGERITLTNPTREASPLLRFLWKILGITSLTGLFLLRVILGRIPWIVASGAAALMWIAYHQPSDQASRDQLMPLARLTDSSGDNWAPDPDKLKHGCVVIVHGLYGNITTGGGTGAWPKVCAKKIETALGSNAPDVCLVDWHQAAQTAKFNRNDVGIGFSEQENLLTDLSGVRPQAEEVGDLVAFRIAMMILDRAHPTILKSQPLHLIGHSAGGFIVSRVAVLLKRLNAAPDQVHVTILDTPAPDPEVTTTLPDMYPSDTVDFYISSDMGGRGETFQTANFSPKIHKYVVPPEESVPAESRRSDFWLVNWIGGLSKRASNIWVAHRYCFEWFMNTIDNPSKYPNEGFNRSPFVKTSRLAPATR